MSKALANQYSVARPAYGGTLTEGTVGIPRFINPLLANSDVDRDLTSLVYKGLLEADGKGNLVPALAETYEISEDGKEYTFTLRDNLRWSDGEPLTVDDVIFTLNIAKNAAYKSIARANWEGVGIEKIDERTIRFSLQKPYAPFLENTTLGIIPMHLWKDMPPQEFSLSDLNIKPIGAGPYIASSLEKNAKGRIISYTLEENPYYISGEPYLETIIIRFYPNETDLIAAFKAREFDAISSVPQSMLTEVDARPDTRIVELNLPRVFGIFYNQNLSKPLSDAVVRRALELATDKERIIRDVLKNQGMPAYSPIPPGMFGAADESVYADSIFNIERANDMLEKAGWKDEDGDGIREKKSKEDTTLLSFSLSVPNSPNLVDTAKLLQALWREAGIAVDVKIFEASDFEQTILRPRKYDAVLFGQVVGRDPDPFAFWHSSQRNDPGLNIALYANTKTDAILEKARGITDNEERREAYLAFQEELKKDDPALFLYAPSYLFAVPQTLQGMDISQISLPNDRFASVHTWYVKTKNVLKLFVR